MAGYAHPDALVDTQWVADHLRDPALRVVEVDVNRQAYDGGHVPGAALWVVYEDLLDPDWRLKDAPAEMAALLARSGIVADTTVVFYGGATNANMPATFGYWLLAASGHQGAHIMDGDRKKWLAEGRPLEGAPPTIAPCPAQPLAPDWRHRARRDLVAGSHGRDDTAPVDVRNPGEYAGELFSPGGFAAPPGERAGHIPCAGHLPYEIALNDDGTFKPADELRRLSYIGSCSGVAVRATAEQRRGPRGVEPPRRRGAAGAWTVSSGRDRASRAKARAAPGERSVCDPTARGGRMGDGNAAYQLYVGIDVAAKSFVAAWLTPGGEPGAPVTGEQTPEGCDTLACRLRATGAAPAATLVVLEATGNYWVALAVALHEAGYRVAVVNPRQAHHFAKAQLRRAKTDALDARDLARLAEAPRPAPWAPPPAVYHEVRQRLVARDGLLAMRTRARNQRHALLQRPVVVGGVRQHLDELIADLDRRVAALEAELAAVLKMSVWAESLACLTSAPGIGTVTAAWLLVGTLNFTLCAGPESLTVYAGLALMPRESGRTVRGRAAIGHDGNGRLRTALYMAALSAARFNPTIRAFYQRLRAAGKPLKVARCAAARKLLHQAWALGSKRQRFDPDHKQQQHGTLPELAA